MSSVPKDKYVAVAHLLGQSGAASVLDAGCRDARLRAVLAKSGVTAAYTGLDLHQNEANSVDLLGDITAGIPLEDGAVDAVVALDVIEHLDDMQAGMDELLRVARQQVIVGLPNMAHFMYRGRFILTARTSAKYDLLIDPLPPGARHRWFTVVPQTDEFFQQYANRRHLEVTTVDIGLPRKAGAIESALRTLRFRRSWHVWSVLGDFRKPL